MLFEIIELWRRLLALWPYSKSQLLKVDVQGSCCREGCYYMIGATALLK